MVDIQATLAQHVELSQQCKKVGREALALLEAGDTRRGRAKAREAEGLAKRISEIEMRFRMN